MKHVPSKSSPLFDLDFPIEDISTADMPIQKHRGTRKDMQNDS